MKWLLIIFVVQGPHAVQADVTAHVFADQGACYAQSDKLNRDAGHLVAACVLSPDNCAEVPK